MLPRSCPACRRASRPTIHAEPRTSTADMNGTAAPSHSLPKHARSAPDDAACFFPLVITISPCEGRHNSRFWAT
ncbi:uncharacterized protein K452DRAFT_151274 [Aplosporella prunicola CBS 121167]|uniref:Uncharacterized protein n=1 Tax=Aplosporella prunicola CBS 121167 TaxID=1176127 RepID=A0A6A6BK32_9PEZI|nr:uncharacterized protein K452DRAFT_151274 [Aplosporella prunicola CBS 121167]KAF2143998.1 hypothetical protein K452DRAFT_151274 [Aplosporella prunicola CBS 121167]